MCDMTGNGEESELSQPSSIWSGQKSLEPDSQYSTFERTTIFILPTPGEVGFWQELDEVHKISVGLLEELAVAVRYFARQGEPDKVDRVFGVLYTLYEEMAARLAHKYCYAPHKVAQSPAVKSVQLVEELGQRVWLKLYQDLANSEPTFSTAYTRNFNWKFVADLKAIARQQGREEGYMPTPERLPSSQKVYLSEPLSTIVSAPEGEELTLESGLFDPFGQSGYDLVANLDWLHERLDEQEKQIIKMLLDRYSKNYIAKTLHIAEKTLNRKIAELEPKLTEWLQPDS